MRLNNFLKFIIAVVVSQAAGVVGSFFTASSVSNWYATLAKPVLNPPSWVFGPVWIILYFMMGVATFLVWRKGLETKGVKLALVVFIFQLVVNAFWSIIFFGYRNPFWALVDLGILWLAVLFTIVLFHKVSKLSAWLFVPYILWISFACYLNHAVLVLN